MSSQLPPLRAIEIFVVAGRCLSFTEAAKATNLTVSAVSRRMRALEVELGVDLFRRFNRRIELTAAGARYLDAMTGAIDLIRKESDRLRPQRPIKILRLSTVPLISAWLMPRLVKLNATRPNLDVQLSTSGELVDLGDGSFDAAVRFGMGKWPGLIADRVLSLAVFPVGAPRLLPQRPAASASALEETTLLGIARAPQLWAEWLRGVGLHGYRSRRARTFDSAEVMFQAAISGAGIALADSALIADHLAAGRLRSVFANPPVSIPQGYYLVYRPAMRDDGRLRALQRALRDGRPKHRLR